MKTAKKTRSEFRVPVCDRVIEVIEFDDGKIMIDAKSLCEAFGMDYTAFLSKCKVVPWDRGRVPDIKSMTVREFHDRYGLTNSQGRPMSDEELAEIGPAWCAALDIPWKKVQAKQAH